MWCCARASPLASPMLPLPLASPPILPCRPHLKQNIFKVSSLVVHRTVSSTMCSAPSTDFWNVHIFTQAGFQAKQVTLKNGLFLKLHGVSPIDYRLSTNSLTTITSTGETKFNGYFGIYKKYLKNPFTHVCARPLMHILKEIYEKNS